MIPVGHLSYCQTVRPAGPQGDNREDRSAAGLPKSALQGRELSWSQLQPPDPGCDQHDCGWSHQRWDRWDDEAAYRGEGSMSWTINILPPVSAADHLERSSYLTSAGGFIEKPLYYGTCLWAWWMVAHGGCHGAAVICCQCNQVRVKRSGPPAAGHLTLSKVSRLTGFKPPVRFGGHCSPWDRDCDGA